MSTFIVSNHEPTSAKVREVLLFAGLECPSSHILSLDTAPSRLGREQPNLILMVLPPDVERALTILSVLRGLVGQCRILAIGPASDARLVLRTLRSGADDYVEASDLESELDAALTRLAQGGADSIELSKLIAVLGPNGGSGSSTLAVNVATALARVHKSACLMDLKLEAGDAAALLDLRPSFTLADLCQNLARLDRVMFERSLVKHSSGVQLLAPPRLYADIEHVTAEGITRALTQARALFPYIVADLDHSFREEQTVVLRQADTIMLVLRLDFAALRNARRTLEHLQHMEIERERIRLVVNRYGQPKEVPASKAEEALGMKIFHYVPEDPRTVNRANNNGVPIVLEAPSTRIAKSVVQLAHNLNGRAPAASKTAPAPREFAS